MFRRSNQSSKTELNNCLVQEVSRVVEIIQITWYYLAVSKLYNISYRALLFRLLWFV